MGQTSSTSEWTLYWIVDKNHIQVNFPTRVEMEKHAEDLKGMGIPSAYQPFPGKKDSEEMFALLTRK